METFGLRYETFDQGLSESLLISTFEDRTEQRRKKGPTLRSFKVKSPGLTKAQCVDYMVFYAGVNGMLDAFFFTSPLDDATYTVRFSKEPDISWGNGLWNCTMEMVEVV